MEILSPAALADEKARQFEERSLTDARASAAAAIFNQYHHVSHSVQIVYRNISSTAAVTATKEVEKKGWRVIQNHIVSGGVHHTVLVVNAQAPDDLFCTLTECLIDGHQCSFERP